MRLEDCFITGVDSNAFRPGELAKVTGIFNVIHTEGGLSSRLCYSVIYEDGRQDLVPLLSLESGEYKFITSN